MILVAGATGSVGGKIVAALRERDEDVRALVRADTAHDAVAATGAEVVFGDLRDADSLKDACRGVDVIISTATATSRSDDTPENVDARGHQNLAAAARDAGVAKFVFASTIGASPDSPVPAFRAKGVAEAAIRDSGVDYTIFQANALMDVWFGMLIEAAVASGRPVTLVGESRRRHSFIAERDVVRFMVAAMRLPEASNRTVPIGGPSAITLRDAVAAYEAALGRSIAIEFVAPGQPIPGTPEPVWGFAAALESFDSPIPMEETARAFRVAMTSVRDFATARRIAALPRQ